MAHEPHANAGMRRMSNNAPVFIVGCPRSGTTLLYDTLLSSRKFAMYRAESDVFLRIAPAFGNLRSAANRRKSMDRWLESDYFRRSGLKADDVRARVVSECRNAGDFLRLVMEGIVREQGVCRWADNTPLHLLYIPEIKKSFPNAKIVHIIRDGRDVAVSLNRLGWCHRFPWDAKHSLAISGLYWQWLVSKGREYGRRLDATDYLELRYEELVQHPQQTMKRLSGFIGEDLDSECIKTNPIGTMVRPNSSFPHMAASTPVGRWKTLASGDTARMNVLLAPLLRELGYQQAGSTNLDLAARRLQTLYPPYWELRQRIRQSALSRFIVTREPLRSGFLDKADARWDAIRASAVDRANSETRSSIAEESLERPVCSSIIR